jgi:CDP-glycerol glycerophosphotransferase
MGSERGATAAPWLSIVVPVYEVEAYLPECLDSILCAQDVEVIAVNDGSTDGCGSILDTYARRDPRLRVVHLPTNIGPGQARNTGLDHATGEYVWFVDADDSLPPDSVEAVRDRLAVTHPDVLIIDHVEMFEKRLAARPRPSLDTYPGLTAPIRLTECPQLLRLAQSACTKVVRRAFLNEIGLRFPPGWYEDSSFSHLLLMTARRIDLLHRVCYRYRRRAQGGITTSVSPRHVEVFDQYERLFTMVNQAGGAYDTFRPELFRMMINHYLVIAGNRRRLPAGMRRAFFGRIAEDYRRWLPAGGYPVPGGLTAIKHWLVKYDAYPAYAACRLASRMVRARGLLNVRRTQRAGRAVSTARALGSATSVRQGSVGMAEGAGPVGHRTPQPHRVDPSRQRSGTDPIFDDEREFKREAVHDGKGHGVDSAPAAAAGSPTQTAISKPMAPGSSARHLRQHPPDQQPREADRTP